MNWAKIFTAQFTNLAISPTGRNINIYIYIFLLKLGFVHQYKKTANKNNFFTNSYCDIIFYKKPNSRNLFKEKYFNKKKSK